MSGHRRTIRILTVLCAATLFSVIPSQATGQTGPTPLDSIVVTRHQVTLSGERVLRYTARAGQLPIRDNETGEPRAHIFFVSYSVDRAPSAPPRPLMFYWNGGPGSSVSQPHLLGFGPRIVKMDDDFATAGPFSETEMVDNGATWLTAADLVFVDPVHTGYSRATRSEYLDSFLNIRGDAESIAEFIRVYQVRFDGQDAPLFIGGESYGTTRSANVADILTRKRIPLQGVVLAALAIPIATRPAFARAAFRLPTYAAAAYHWKKLPADLMAKPRREVLAEVEAWASGPYMRALAHPDSLSDAERRATIERLVRYTGLDAGVIGRDLTIGSIPWQNNFLKKEGLLPGLYETRRAIPMPAAGPTRTEPTTDAGLMPQLLHMNGTSVLLTRYIRKELGYRNDLLYQGPFGGAYPTADVERSDWMSTRWMRNGAARGGRPDGADIAYPVANQIPPLRRAMEAYPNLRVLSQCGYHDTLCNYYENVSVVSTLDPAWRSRFTVRAYDGGHEAYLTKQSRLAMQRDFAAFVSPTVSQ